MRAFAGLRGQAAFDRLRRRGRRTVTPALTVYRDAPRPSESRSVVGITVAKPVGIAVVRNRVRRRLAAIAHDALSGAPARRLLIVARPEAAAASYAALWEQFLRAVR